jgi:hypothetical protein
VDQHAGAHDAGLARGDESGECRAVDSLGKITMPQIKRFNEIGIK